MNDRPVHFLHAGSRGVRHVHMDVGVRADASSIPSGQRQDPQAARTGRVHTGGDVRRLTAGGDRDRKPVVACRYSLGRPRHFPMQNWLKMESSKSSVVVFPTTSPMALVAMRSSMAATSSV